MPQTITELSPGTVIDAIESNLVEASAALRAVPKASSRGPDVTWVYTGYPLLSRIMRARFSGGQADDRVNEILSCFKKWDAAVSWLIGPGNTPIKLAESLHKAGFGSSESRTAMAMSLIADPSDVTDPPWPAGLRIQSVTDEVGLRAWATLSSDASFNGDADGAVQIFSPQNAGGHPNCRYYIGYLDGQPIARAMSFTDAEITGIYWLTTLRPFRGRGVGQAMAHRLLSDARQTGSKLAVIPTPHSGLELCRRIGFKPYCQYNVYHWPPSPLRMPYC